MKGHSLVKLGAFLMATFFLSIAPSITVMADDTCSEATGGECDAAQDLIDLGRDNPVVDLTGEPDRAEEELEDQPDFQGSSADEEDE